MERKGSCSLMGLDGPIYPLHESASHGVVRPPRPAVGREGGYRYPGGRTPPQSQDAPRFSGILFADGVFLSESLSLGGVQSPALDAPRTGRVTLPSMMFRATPKVCLGFENAWVLAEAASVGAHE